MASWFQVFSRVWKPDETGARVFEITSPTKKISRNYHFNKFSEFTEHILFEMWNTNLSVTC